jgi:hypothetical protein
LCFKNYKCHIYLAEEIKLENNDDVVMSNNQGVEEQNQGVEEQNQGVEVVVEGSESEKQGAKYLVKSKTSEIASEIAYIVACTAGAVFWGAASIILFSLTITFFLMLFNTEFKDWLSEKAEFFKSFFDIVNNNPWTIPLLMFGNIINLGIVGAFKGSKDYDITSNDNIANSIKQFDNQLEKLDEKKVDTEHLKNKSYLYKATHYIEIINEENSPSAQGI